MSCTCSASHVVFLLDTMESDFRDMLDHIANCWNRHNAEHCTVNFADDCSMIDMFGHFSAGRENMHRRIEELLQDAFLGATSTGFQDVRTHYVTPDVVLLDCEQQLGTTQNAHQLPCTLCLRRRDGEWKLVAWRYLRRISTG